MRWRVLLVKQKQWAICGAPTLPLRNEDTICNRIDKALQAGAGMYDMSCFKQKFPSLAKTYVGASLYDHWQQDVYASFVHCYPHRSYVLYVPSGVYIAEPIQLPVVMHTTCAYNNIYIVLGQDAYITVQYEQIGLACTSITMHLEQRAHLNFIQKDKHAQEQYTYIAAYQQKRSVLSIKALHTQTTYNMIQLFLQEQYAQSHVTLGVDTKGSIHSWFKTEQVHQASDTQSTLSLKGVLDDQSRSTHLGKIYIGQEAQRVEADLKSHYLLMTNQSQAYALPSLEVLTNDVQCLHASTIGSFDEQQVFYMMSRGLSVNVAKELLKDAFLDVNSN